MSSKIRSGHDLPAPVGEQMLLPFAEFCQPVDAKEGLGVSPPSPGGGEDQAPAGASVANSSGAAPQTLGELYALLEADPSKHWEHAQIKSAIRQVGVILGMPLSDIPTELAALRALIAAALPAAHHMTQARWSRCVGLMMKALTPHFPDLMPRRQRGGHSVAWKAVFEKLPGKEFKTGLSRFASHCTRQGLEPEDVAPAAFESYREVLERGSLQKNPVFDYRQAISLWNRAVAAMPGWEDRAVPAKASERFYSLAWDRFPKSFVDDLEAFLSHERNPDIFADSYRRQPKESTIVAWRRLIRQIASLLVGTGVPIEQVTCLAFLVEGGNAHAALRAQQARQGRNSVSLGSQAAILALIAKYWVKDERRGKELRAIVNRALPKRKGMTQKNRARLRQFDLRANKLALLRLPGKVFAELAHSDQVGVAEARRAMYALAVAILIVAPIRALNLVSLEHNRHFQLLRRRRERLRVLYIPAAEIKNNEDFEMRLEEEESLLIDTWLADFRPRISPAASPWLFPNSTGGRRDCTAFTQGMCDFVRRETGLIVHTHLFRQLAGKFHLDEDPSDIETVRQILRHRSTETTHNHYAEQKTARAFEAYGKSVAKLKADPIELALKRPVRARRKRKPNKGRP